MFDTSFPSPESFGKASLAEAGFGRPRTEGWRFGFRGVQADAIDPLDILAVLLHLSRL